MSAHSAAFGQIRMIRIRAKGFVLEGFERPRRPHYNPIRAHPGSSGLIRAHPGSSGLIRAHPGSSGIIRAFMGSNWNLLGTILNLLGLIGANGPPNIFLGGSE